MAAISDYLEPILNGKSSAELRAQLEWLERREYRAAAENLLRVLYALDEIMAHSRQPERDWQQISLALGLPSSRYLELTEIRIAARFGICKMAVSKSITKLLRLAAIQPNGRGYNGRFNSHK